MNFNDLLTFVTEGGEEVVGEFETLLGGDNMPEFISFNYLTQRGERAKYTVNIGMSYQRIKENNINKIQKAQENPDVVKKGIQSKLERIAGSLEGEVNGQPVQSILDAVPAIIDKILQAESQSLNLMEQEAPTAAAATEQQMVKGIKKNLDTGVYYIEGVVRSKKLSGDKAESKMVKSRSPLTAGEPFVKKYLKLNKPQKFIIQPSLMQGIKVRQTMVDVDGQQTAANTLELDGEFRADSE